MHTIDIYFLILYMLKCTAIPFRIAGYSNAAPEWQASSLGLRRGIHTEACPLKGRVERHGEKQTIIFASDF
jgi:hypothetical protein